MKAIVALMVAVALNGAEVSAAVHGDTQLADLDRSKFPADVQPYIYHLTTSTIPNAAERKSLEVALRLVVPSTTRQQIIQRCLVSRVNGSKTLYRLNLLELKWDLNTWYEMLAKYPYHPRANQNPRLIRADWLLLQLTDQQEADVYYKLVFGVRPKNRDEALKILGVSSQAEFFVGLIEGESGVAKNKYRRIENRPNTRGYAWGTNDFLQMTADRDPLEKPEAAGLHDGEEWIIGIPKIDLRTGTWGALQVYFLADGNGNLVNRAPVDLVEDYTEFRGLREIRNPGSCITCHKSGLNWPTKNELRETIKSGTDLYAIYPENENIERFHFSDHGKYIERDNEDYQAIVKIMCGCSSAEASEHFMRAIDRYDQEVDLNRLAEEVYMRPEEVRMAIDWMSKNNYYLGPRFPQVARGQTIPRDAVEDRYYQFRLGVDQWRQTIHVPNLPNRAVDQPPVPQPQR